MHSVIVSYLLEKLEVHSHSFSFGLSLLLSLVNVIFIATIFIEPLLRYSLFITPSLKTPCILKLAKAGKKDKGNGWLWCGKKWNTFDQTAMETQ